MYFIPNCVNNCTSFLINVDTYKVAIANVFANVIANIATYQNSITLHVILISALLVVCLAAKPLKLTYDFCTKDGIHCQYLRKY